MLNFNSCIFEPPQPISSHFIGAPASFSHSYYYYFILLLFFIIPSEYIFFYMYFFLIFVGEPKNRQQQDA
jgi:uncharacterized membrane protein